MPRVSSFYGVTIRMFFNEDFHPGRPHFHAEYAGAKASFGIASLDRIAGGLPPRVEKMVKRWACLHRIELMANWERARSHKPLEPVDPLR
jgi:hypothetical protein